MNIETIAVAVAMATLMFYTGLLFDPSLFRGQIRHSNLSGFGGLAFANYVIIPLLTLCAIWLFSFPPVLNLVLLTLAMLPCAPLVPAMASMWGEPPEWSLLVFLCMSVLNIALVPILMAVLALPWAAGDDAKLGGGEGIALIKYVLSVYGPMSMGAAVRIFAPRQFPFWLKLLRKLVPMLFLVAFALFVFSRQQELLDIGLRELGALALFELICIAVGLAFAQRTANNRITNVLVCTVRNFAMGIAFTTIVFPHTAAPTYMMLFTTLTLLGTAIWLGISKWLTVPEAKYEPTHLKKET